MEERDRRIRAADLDPGRVGRVVGLYLVAAVVWIVASGVVVEDLAANLGVTPTTVEVAKGLLFVLVTAGILYPSLRRWAQRLQAAALAEQAAAARMRHAEDMRSNFLTGVSHELRTPLTAIVGFSETIERQEWGLSGGQLQVISRRLVVNAHRLESLVVDLLEVDHLLQGLGKLRLEPVDLGALARRIAATYDGQGHSVSVEGPPVTVDIDVAKIERVIEHLIDNATRHTPEGTSVTVLVGGDEQRVHLRVEDDGHGLPDPVVGDLFQPFVQDPDAVRRASPGIGIGLTLVAQYAELHHGSATAENRDGGGARFTVTLPRSQAPTASATGRGAVTPVASRA